MKNLLFAIIFIGLTVFLGYKLYEGGGSFDWFGGDKEPEETNVRRNFPDEIEIVRKDRSRLNVLLTARNATHIQFERLSDGAEFTYEIAGLDADTKKRVMQYPDSGLSNVVEVLRAGGVSLDVAYIEQLREAISEIDAKIKDRKRRQSISQSKTERLTLKREIEDLERDRKELEAKIEARTDG